MKVSVEAEKCTSNQLYKEPSLDFEGFWLIILCGMQEMGVYIPFANSRSRGTDFPSLKRIEIDLVN